MQFREFRPGISTGAACASGLSIVATFLAALPFPEDFVKRSHLGEVKITGRPAHLSIRTGVIGPGEPGHQLIWFHPQLLEFHHMMEIPFLPPGHGASQFHELGFRTRPRDRDAKRVDAKVIPNRAVERKLLQR